MQHWLLKTEPEVFSYTDLARLGSSPWDGIRNYQARNHLRQMNIGDLALIYHSSTNPPGIAGIARITKTAHPDKLQFDPESQYYDPKSPLENPRWSQIMLSSVQELPFLELSTLRTEPKLEQMLILRKGNRLSVTPVEKKHFQHILKMAGVLLI
jgi:predicted RNA-binding protein with PUA-like domain